MTSRTFNCLLEDLKIFMRIVVDGGFIKALRFVPEEYGTVGEKREEEIALIDKTEKQLREYFAGSRKIFDLPISLEGTPFRKKVWETLRNVEYGKTCSYATLAELSGYEGAVRAVGTAMKTNMFPIILPCHRVVLSSGGIGEYNGGKEIKRRLLHLERQNCTKN